MNSLFNYWQEEKIPIVNGIIFPDDTVWPVHPVDAPRDLPLHLLIQDNKQITLDDSTQWTGCTPLIEVTDIDLGLTAVAGECGMGGDGYIALLENGDRQIRWLAFFDFSNPFERLSFEANYIIAHNNLNEIWKIPIDAKGIIEVRSNES